MKIYRRYYGSQTTAAGSPTSVVLPRPHQSDVDWTKTWRWKGLLPAIVDLDFLLPEPRHLCSGHRLGTTASCSGQRRGVGPSAAGSGAQVGDNRWQQSLPPPCLGSCTSGSQSKSSFPETVTQTTVLLWKYQRRQRTDVLCAITTTAERLSR